jgi:ribosome-binding factor A
MVSSHYHLDRLKEQLRREIGTVIAHEMRDPRIPQVVTVTNVKLAQDTRNATVQVSIYGDDRIKSNALAALNAAASFIQRTVAARITVKRFPRLYFKQDDSIEYSRHINDLLKEIHDDLGKSS